MSRREKSTAKKKENYNLLKCNWLCGGDPLVECTGGPE